MGCVPRRWTVGGGVEALDACRRGRTLSAAGSCVYTRAPGVPQVFVCFCIRSASVGCQPPRLSRGALEGRGDRKGGGGISRGADLQEDACPAAAGPCAMDNGVRTADHVPSKRGALWGHTPQSSTQRPHSASG